MSDQEDSVYQIIRIARTLEQLDGTEQDVSGLLGLILPKLDSFDGPTMFFGTQWPNQGYPRTNAIRQLARYLHHHCAGRKEAIPDTKPEILTCIKGRLQEEAVCEYERRVGPLSEDYSSLRDNTPENQFGDWKRGQRHLAVSASYHFDTPIEIVHENQVVDSF